MQGDIIIPARSFRVLTDGIGVVEIYINKYGNRIADVIIDAAFTWRY